MGTTVTEHLLLEMNATLKLSPHIKFERLLVAMKCLAPQSPRGYDVCNKTTTGGRRKHPHYSHLVWGSIFRVILGSWLSNSSLLLISTCVMCFFLFNSKPWWYCSVVSIVCIHYVCKSALCCGKFVFCSCLCVHLGYVRIVFALISFYFMPTNHVVATWTYIFSSLLDAFDGYAARLLNQGILWIAHNIVW